MTIAADPRPQKRRTRNGRQQCTRVPPYWPGDWVKVRMFSGDPDSLSGRVLRVKSLTCAITSADQKAAVWRVHFDCGRCLEWHMVERKATRPEIARTFGATVPRQYVGPAQQALERRAGGTATGGPGPDGYTYEFDAADERARRDREGEAQRLGVEVQRG